MARKNISVPDPEGGEHAIVDQAFVRDPDGYYIEFCNCASHEDILQKPIKKIEVWDIMLASQMMKIGNIMKRKANKTREVVQKRIVSAQSEVYQQNLPFRNPKILVYLQSHHTPPHSKHHRSNQNIHFHCQRQYSNRSNPLQHNRLGRLLHLNRERNVCCGKPLSSASCGCISSEKLELI